MLVLRNFVLTHRPPNNLSANLLVCFTFQGWWKCPSVNILDPDETPIYSTSHPDPSCMALSLCLVG